MAEISHKLFPCRVFPDTTFHAQLKAHAFAFVLLVLLLGICAILHPLAVLVIPLLAPYVLSWWFFSRKPNDLMGFFRAFEHHCGNETPVESIRLARPIWFIFAIIALAEFGLAPFARLIAVYLVVGARLYWIGKSNKVKPTVLLRELLHVQFIFLAYPDQRYRAPGGTAAMWIPRWSMFDRRAYLALQLLPFLLAIVAGVEVNLFMSGLTLGQALGDAVLLLPLPQLALSVLNAEVLCALKRTVTKSALNFEADWGECVSRVRGSRLEYKGIPISDHFFLGFTLPKCEQPRHPHQVFDPFDLPCRTPVLAHESAFDGHCHVLGGTGARKSTTGILGVAFQAMNGRWVTKINEHGKPVVGPGGRKLCEITKPPPMMFLDMKGDPVVKNAIEQAAIRRGQTFRAFTLEARKSSSYFSALTDIQCRDGTPLAVVETILSALDLFHGEFTYGKGYYGERSRFALLKQFLETHSRIESWKHLYETMRETFDARELKDAFELLGRVFALAQFPLLGPAPAGSDVIHMPQVIERNECVYFWLPSLANSMSVITVAKLAAFSFLEAARDWNTSGAHESKRPWLFWDEAQVAVGSNIERFFQQASAGRIRIVLSNHSVLNLDTSEAPNLGRTIFNNTRVKQAFGLGDPREREDWIKLAGEEKGEIITIIKGKDGEGHSTSSMSVQQIPRARLNHDVINSVGNLAGGSLLLVTRDAGLARNGGIPLPIVCPSPVSWDDYQRHERTPWPTAPETKVRSGESQTTMVNVKGAEEIDAEGQGHYAKLQKLFEDAAKKSGRRDA